MSQTGDTRGPPAPSADNERTGSSRSAWLAAMAAAIARRPLVAILGAPIRASPPKMMRTRASPLLVSTPSSFGAL